MPEEFTPPTYREYKRATAFARVRYKYGLIVLILCWVTLILLIIFIINYESELSTHPLKYAAQTINGECTCITTDKIYIFNRTSMMWRAKELNFYYFPRPAP